jgi:hypothetical protein
MAPCQKVIKGKTNQLKTFSKENKKDVILKESTQKQDEGIQGMRTYNNTFDHIGTAVSLPKNSKADIKVTK